MLKNCFVFLLLFTSFFANSQDNPVPKLKNSFTFGISGLQNIGVNRNAGPIATILYRQYRDELTAWRLGLDISGYRSNAVTYAPAPGWQTVTRSSGYNVQLAAGIQRSFSPRPSGAQIRRIESYIGSDFIAGIADGNSLTRREVFDATLTPSHPDDYMETYDLGGFSWNAGVRPFVGVNFYVLPQMSIGAEFGYTLQYRHTTPTRQQEKRRENNIDAEVMISKMNGPSSSISAARSGSGVLNVSVFF